MLATTEKMHRAASAKPDISHTRYKAEHLLPLGNNLGDGMPDDDTGFLGFFLGQPTGDAHLEGGYGCPASIARVDAEAERESFEACDEDAICETLRSMLAVCCRAYSLEECGVYLINNIAQDLVLVVQAEVLGCDHLVLQDKQHYGVVH